MSKTNILNWQTKGSLFIGEKKKIKSNVSDFLNFVRFFTFFFSLKFFLGLIDFWIFLVWIFSILKERIQFKKKNISFITKTGEGTNYTTQIDIFFYSRPTSEI